MTNEEIGRAFVALDCWRWMPGAQWVAARVGLDTIIGRVHRYGDTGQTTPVPLGAVPDVTDPATIGCLVAFMRNVLGDPFAQPTICNGPHWHAWLDDHTVAENQLEALAILREIRLHESAENDDDDGNNDNATPALSGQE